MREWAKPGLSWEGILESRGGPSISWDFIATIVSSGGQSWGSDIYLPQLPLSGRVHKRVLRNSTGCVLFLGAERPACRWNEGYLIKVSPTQGHSEGSFGSTWWGHSCLLGTAPCLWPGGLECGEAPVLSSGFLVSLSLLYGPQSDDVLS